MLNNPLISVIIPVYNVAPYLKEALDSVINQTYNNLEIIIIDDGSSDGSEKICDSYKLKDSRINLIHQDNKGVSAARNAGLDEMNGDYVSFLDPDDAFRPIMLEKMIEESLKYNADVVVCNYDTIWTEGRLNYNIRKKKKSSSQNHFLLSSTESQKALFRKEIDNCVWNKLYKRELLDNVRFPIGHVYEDIFTMYRIFEESYLVSIIQESYIIHRIRKGSITTTNTLNNALDKFRARKKVEEYINSHTPEIFSSQDLLLYREWTAAYLSLYYSEIRYRNHSPEESKLLFEEAENQWNSLNRKILKKVPEIIHFLFKYSPFLLSIVRPCWGIVKRCAPAPKLRKTPVFKAAKQDKRDQ